MAITLRIEPDNFAGNPREECDNVGMMVCWHRRYDLGDKHDFKNQDDFFRSLLPEDVAEDIDNWLDNNTDDYRDEALVEHTSKLFEAVQQTHVILPLYLYDHGGITISTSPFSCRWDSGQVGYIYCSIDRARRELGTDNPNTIADYLKGEVETYDKFLNGDIYGYIVEDEDGEELDSCWGFYGEDAAIEAGEDILKYYQSKADEQAARELEASRPDMYYGP